jgi:hypothetical protein
MGVYLSALLPMHKPMDRALQAGSARPSSLIYSGQEQPCFLIRGLLGGAVAEIGIEVPAARWSWRPQ